MDSSQGSVSKGFLLRDTFGPISAPGASVSRESSVSESHSVTNDEGRADTISLDNSSSCSSIRELSRADDTGLRSSFREQPFVHVDDDETDNEATNKAKVEKVQVYTVPSDIEIQTPDMTKNGGSRSFFQNGGMHNINMVRIQQNYDDLKLNGNLSSGSVRHGIRQHERDNVIEHIFNEDVTRRPTTVTIKHKVKNTLFVPKLMTFLLVIIIVIGGMVALIYFKKEDKPDAQRGRVIVNETKEREEDVVKNICPDVSVKPRDVIHFNCSIREVKFNKDTLHQLIIKPPPYVNKGKPFVVQVQEKEEKNATWSAYFDVHANFHILRVRGPEATCSSGGTYQVEFRDKSNSSKYDTTLQISVKNEVLRVNVSLSQNTENNNTDFTLGCSTNSGCEQSFVDFFAEINKEENFLRGVNFSCTIKYNDYDGYSVSCMGNIPDYLMSQFERITCRPRSTLLDDFDEDESEDLEVEIELPNCDLTKHCGYECTDERDYFVVSRQRCDIFHRCYKKNVFTSYCAPGTFFDPHVDFCACRHTVDLQWCQQNGALKPGSDATDITCS